MTDFWKVIFLGLIEGLTEFIPVSSTGHLIITESFLKLSFEQTESFSVFIQLGAILAVVIIYWRRFMDALDFSREEHNLSGFNAIRLYFIACLPAFVLGALFHSTIKELLFSPITVAWALIVGGVLFCFVEKRNQNRPFASETLDELTVRQALLVGLFQCLALWPGMSRSGSTIVGGMIAGLSRRVAAEFSFLIAVPVMVAAVGYDLYKTNLQLSDSDLLFFGLGFVVSFITAICAIKFFLHLLNHYTLVPFGVYRVILGISVLYLF